jgi:predicted Zn-dependent peptidase
VSQVDAYLRQNFTPERTVVAVVGPVDADEAAEVLRPHMPEGELTLTRPEPPAPGDTLRDVDYNSLTTWVAVTWRFTPDSDVEALRMLARLAQDRVSFGPSRRSVYNSRGEVLPFAGGGELRLSVVIPPREASQWAVRLREAVDEYAGEALPPTVFAERLRRYRGVRLLELELPEARAAVMARAALLGDPSATLVDFTGLTPARLQAAARALQPPIIVFLGPKANEGA